jgi:hypothetical protein
LIIKQFFFDDLLYWIFRFLNLFMINIKNCKRSWNYLNLRKKILYFDVQVTRPCINWSLWFNFFSYFKSSRYDIVTFLCHKQNWPFLSRQRLDQLEQSEGRVFYLRYWLLNNSSPIFIPLYFYKETMIYRDDLY